MGKPFQAAYSMRVKKSFSLAKARSFWRNVKKGEEKMLLLNSLNEMKESTYSAEHRGLENH